MHSKHDEAYAALAVSIEIKKNRGYYAKMLMRRYEISLDSDYWHFRLFAHPPQLPLYSANRQIGFLFNVFGSLHRTVTGPTTGTILSPFTLAMHGVRYLGLRIGLGAVAALATGDDFGGERIRSFARRPAYLTANDLEIPTILDDELKELAVKNSSEVLQGVYELLSAPVAINVAEIVRKTLTNPYLVHSQYYQHEQLICQIASVISGSENGLGRAESTSS